jgi:hypothetical protein
MKRFAFVATTFLLAAGASNAAEIRNAITTSVQLKVTPAVTVTAPTPDTYAVSGTNIDATSLGGAGKGTGTYEIMTNGAAFSFSESTSSGGISTTTQTGGTTGSLAGTITPGSGTSLTLTAGSIGTEAIGQTSIELSVFQ